MIDSRSPAADALLCYRDPPTSPRSDRLVDLETRNVELCAELEKLSQRTNGGPPFPEDLKGWWEERKDLTSRLEELRAKFSEINDRLREMKV